jgi:hypothetical protein
MEILAKIQEIEQLSSETDELEKQNLIKKYLETYLLDYESHCFEEAWNELTAPNAKDLTLLKEGIEQTFSKRIGSLSFECRRVKLLKYL